LNGKHVVFGRVEKGQDIIKKIEGVQTGNNKKGDNRPKERVTIRKCGLVTKELELAEKQDELAALK
jgi:cyclophilin family peptidyl-prolyl cis-trans isomerase